MITANQRLKSTRITAYQKASVQSSSRMRLLLRRSSKYIMDNAFLVLIIEWISVWQSLVVTAAVVAVAAEEEDTVATTVMAVAMRDEAVDMVDHQVAVSEEVVVEEETSVEVAVVEAAALIMVDLVAEAVEDSTGEEEVVDAVEVSEVEADLGAVEVVEDLAIVVVAAVVDLVTVEDAVVEEALAVDVVAEDVVLLRMEEIWRCALMIGCVPVATTTLRFVESAILAKHQKLMMLAPLLNL